MITASSKRCNKVCELFQQCMSEYRAGVDSSTIRDSDIHTHSHTLWQSDFVSCNLTCHNNRLCAVCYHFGSDPNILLAVSERDSFIPVCRLVFSGEWVCQAQPLSPVLDRLHEMAEGVTTR